jgi:hypothetical protein
MPHLHWRGRLAFLRSEGGIETKGGDYDESSPGSELADRKEVVTSPWSVVSIGQHTVRIADAGELVSAVLELAT